VLQLGQDLALLTEAPQQLLLQDEAGARQLEGNSLAKVPVVALGQVDHRHATASGFLEDSVGADAGTGGGGIEVSSQTGEDRCSELLRRLIQEMLRLLAGVQQPLNLGAQLGVRGAGGVQEGCALLGRQLQCSIEQLLDLLPVVGRGRWLHSRAGVRVTPLPLRRSRAMAP
jgi:hypothetical protein